MSYDIFHLSYKETYADDTYSSLKEKFPWARRVKGVKGIFNAHQQCSRQAYTEMFYVVDADADLNSNFDFSFEHCVTRYFLYRTNFLNLCIYKGVFGVSFGFT